MNQKAVRRIDLTIQYSRPKIPLILAKYHLTISKSHSINKTGI